MNVKNLWRRLFFRGGSPLTAAGIPAGFYHYERTGGNRTLRTHLRVDPSGNGLLLANGKNGVRLHPESVNLAKAILDDQEESASIRQFTRLFRDVGEKHARADWRQARELIARLELPGNDLPFFWNGDDSFSPEQVPLERPFSAEVPLSRPFYMDALLKRLWEEAIPHATIIAGKNPTEKELVRAVSKAEKLGLITGVRGFGSQLSVGSRIQDLAQAGLVHLDVYCLSIEEKIHESLTEPGDYKLAVKSLVTAQKRGMRPVAVIPLVRAVMPTIEKTLAALAAHGIEHACLWPLLAAEPHPAAGEVFRADEFASTMRVIDEAAVRHAIQLVRCPPVRRNFELTLTEQIFRGPLTSGDGSIRVEPDGRVFAARGRSKPAGNLLKDSWDDIAGSRIYKNFRKHVEEHLYCRKCVHPGVCVADCVKPVEGPEEEE